MTRKRNDQKALATVMDFLAVYIGEKAVAGTPHFDAARQTWSIPVMCVTPRGIFFGGKVELDAHFDIVQAPSKSEFTRVVEAQLKRLPSVVYAGEAELEAKGFEVVKIS